MVFYRPVLENIKKTNLNQKFEYLISSSPKFKGTLVDYGINIENINKVELAIKNDARSHEPYA